MKNFEGVFTALITPFKSDQIDLDSYRALVQKQLDAGIHGLVVNGTTAESPNLSKEEVLQLFTATKEIVGDKIPIVLGSGSNSTHKTIQMTQWAQEIGADAALVVVPYYNKPSQEGLFQHFSSIAKSVDLPIILYNVPGRTIVRMEIETQKKLASLPNVIAVKDATGDLEFGQSSIEQMPEGFIVTSGDDDSFLGLTLMGGKGVTSVISNIFPKEMVELYDRAVRGDASVLEDFKKYSEFLKYLYCEPNPVPAKMAAHLQGIISTAEMRLPLVRMTVANTQKLRNTLENLGAL